MTPFEKLQKLIEIAWENGWELIKPNRPLLITNEDVCLDFVFLKNDYEESGVNVRHEGAEAYDHATIIFDHSFIDALCKAKYGETHQDMMNLTFESPSEVTLKTLAISTNRIDYLWENFGGAPES